MAEFKNLSALLDPQSVAIVGASPKAGWPARLWANLRHARYPGRVYPVNPNYETMWGVKCYRSLEELPELVDHAVVIIPADRVIELLRNSPRPLFRSATIYSGGFGEGGDPKGLERREFVHAYAREKNVRFCGPNCMGLLSTRSRAMLFPDQRLAEIHEGGLSLVAQSGGLLGSLARAALGWGIGLSYLVTSGNEADAEISDYLWHFLHDERTKVIGAFIEGVRDGEKFVAVGREALKLGKPIIALKIGRSAQGNAAAMAHTGALAGNDRVFDAVCRQNGILRVRNLDELLNCAELFLNLHRLPRGKKTAFVTFSGGLKGLLADLAQDAEVELSQFMPETETELHNLLGVGSSVGNPLDTGWGGLSSQETYLKCVQLVLDDPQVDLLALQEELPQNNVRPDKQSNLVALAEVAKGSPKPLAIYSMTTQSINDYGREFKQSCRLPFLQGAENTVQTMKRLAMFGEAVRLYRGETEKAPATLKPLSVETKEKLAGKKILSEWESCQVMSECDLSLCEMRLAANSSETIRAADEIGYPVAVKLVASGVTHKSELGGVKLNLSAPHEVERACQEIEAGFQARNPGASVEGFLVQEMVRGGVETIIGTDNDPQFGPVVMFGLGGTAVELYRDVTFRMAPIAADEARRMIRGIKGYPLLAGFRGAPPVDLDALCRAIVSLSELATSGRDLIQSIDINPFICLPNGGKAVDAVIVTRASAEEKSRD
jgi:acyl-CoA synthetase (NDP forming)